MKQKLYFLALVLLLQFQFFGQAGTHLNFDGTNDYVNIGNPIASSSSYTKEAWIKTNDISGSNILSNGGAAFWFYQGNLQSGHGGGFANVVASASSLVNTWSHVAVTYDSASTTMTLYINGAVVSQSATVPQYTASNMQIGAFISGAVFNGDIDEVRIWNIARTTEQISGAKFCELQGTETGLVSNFKFNQGFSAAANPTVTTLTNAVSGGTTGTLTNFALTGSTSNWLAGSPVTTGSVVPSAPTVTSPVAYAQGATPTALTATTGGTGLLWYTVSTGGTGSTSAPTPSTSTVGSTSYWVSSTNANGCESTRTQITVTVALPATQLNFDGVDDYVNLGNTISNALNGTTALTLEAWINPSVLNGWNNVITDYDATVHKYILRVRNTNNIQFWINGTALNSTFAVPLNTWTHIAGVYDGTTMYVYANGVLLASQAASITLPVSSDQVNIGSRIGTNTENFTGNIDDVRVWNVARTTEQISGSRFCELQGTETGLVSYFKFNQGFSAAANPTVTTLTNAVSGGTSGTLTNFALTGSTSNWLAGSQVTTGSVVPSAPTVTSPVVYAQGATATALTATTGGTGLLWYTVSTGGTGSASAPTPSTSTAGSTPYWVSSTNANGCESARTQITVAIQPAGTHLDFDGVNDLVNCGTSLNAVIDPLNKLTVQAWVKPSSSAGLGVIIGNYANSDQNSMQFLLRRDSNDYTFWVSGSTGVFKVVNATNAVTVNTWQHVVGVWNGSDLKIYINGTLTATTTGVTESSFASTTNSIIIGNNQAATGAERFTGSIDEVRIWNKALTAADILATKDCEAQSQPELIAYYKFNQGSNAVANPTVTSLINSVSGGANGTLTNFALTGTTSNWLSGSPVTTGTICTTLGNQDFVTSNVNLKVYPNPTKSNVTVEFANLTDAKLQVLDINGRVLITKLLNETSTNIDTNSLPIGMYLFKINANEGTSTSKVIKN